MAVNNEQFLEFHIATDVFKSSCSQLHLRIRRGRVGALCFQKDLKLTVSLHLVMCACQSANQHLAAAWTCISDAHLAVATRLRCVFHMTVVTHSSSDLSPRGVANMICSSQHSPDGFPANLLSDTGGWWECVRVRRGWRSKRTLPGGFAQDGGGPSCFITNPAPCGWDGSNTSVLFMVYSKIITAASILAWWMSLSASSLDL